MIATKAQNRSKPAADADTNRHVKEYLSYYLSFPHSPRYAVLLNGAWGIGKTFLVKRFLKQLPKEQAQRAIYVSLFGLTALDEIDDAVLRATYPALGWTVTRIAGRIAKSAARHYNIEPNVK